jgi:hypothetical protein
MASRTSKASKAIETNTSVDADGKVCVGKNDKAECLLVRGILGSMRR